MTRIMMMMMMMTTVMTLTMVMQVAVVHLFLLLRGNVALMRSPLWLRFLARNGCNHIQYHRWTMPLVALIVPIAKVHPITGTVMILISSDLVSNFVEVLRSYVVLRCRSPGSLRCLVVSGRAAEGKEPRGSGSCQRRRGAASGPGVFGSWSQVIPKP